MADDELSDDVDLPEGDDFEDAPEEIDEDLVDDDVAADDDDDDDFVEADDEVEEEEEVEAVVAPVPAPAKPRRANDDEEEEEDEDDVSDDDVEADLDTILKDRIAAQPVDDDDEEDEAQPEADDRSDGSGRIQPRRPGEFVCQSCFLVKHPSQLADSDSMLCTDCV
ncbi:MAG: DUF4193 family protein [Acidimicrobiales bacterium]